MNIKASVRLLQSPVKKFLKTLFLFSEVCSENHESGKTLFSGTGRKTCLRIGLASPNPPPLTISADKR